MIDFGYFKGLPYEDSNESFEEYQNLKNEISKAAVIEHIESLEVGLTSLPSYDFFTGEKLHAGVIWDGHFVFPYEFLHYYKNYDIGIPYEYEEYLKKIGVGQHNENHKL